MGRKTVTLPPPRVRNEWQRRRDEALRNAGRTKADVHRMLVCNFGQANAPSPATVQAVLDGRFGNEDVETAFLRIIGAEFGVRKQWDKARAKFFPEEEPPFRSGGAA